MISVPAVKERLAELIDSAVNGLQAFDGPPTGALGDRVLSIGRAVGRVSDRDRRGRALPFGTLEEQYDVFGTLSVSRSGTDRKAAVRQLFEDLKAIKAAILADPTLGLAQSEGVAEALPLGQVEYDDRLDSTGVNAWLIFAIQVTARVDG